MKTFWVASQATPPSCMSPSGNSFCRPLQNAAMATLGSASCEQCILTTHECVDRDPNHVTGPRGRTSKSLVADTPTVHDKSTHFRTPPHLEPKPMLLLSSSSLWTDLLKVGYACPMSGSSGTMRPVDTYTHIVAMLPGASRRKTSRYDDELQS